MYSKITKNTQRSAFIIFLLALSLGRIGSVSATTENTHLIIDDRSSGNLNSNIGTRWRFVTDGVMGGISSGLLTLENIKEKNCLRIRGDVRTDNNGGFIQLALPLSDTTNEDTPFDATPYNGIEIEVSGNNQNYNLHFRTDELWFPWQSYRFSFDATPDWQTYRIPFTQLESYMTMHSFAKDEIIQLGLVAIGREFQADLCLASIKFYSE